MFTVHLLYRQDPPRSGAAADDSGVDPATVRPVTGNLVALVFVVGGVVYSTFCYGDAAFFADAVGALKGLERRLTHGPVDIAELGSVSRSSAGVSATRDGIFVVAGGG